MAKVEKKKPREAYSDDSERNLTRAQLLDPTVPPPIGALNPGKITPRKNLKSQQMKSRTRYRDNTYKIYNSINME